MYTKANLTFVQTTDVGSRLCNHTENQLADKKHGTELASQIKKRKSRPYFFNGKGYNICQTIFSPGEIR